MPPPPKKGRKNKEKQKQNRKKKATRKTLLKIIPDVPCVQLIDVSAGSALPFTLPLIRRVLNT